MSDNVPMDMWREILIRLPADSLIRSRAVCKRWLAVIDDPPFVRAHQQQLINENKILIIRRNSSYGYSLDLETLSFSNGHQTIPGTPLPRYSSNRHSRSLSFKFHRLPGPSACHGLVLTTEQPFEIWNPLTDERLDLPPPRDFEQSVASGLGYDYVTDDYKVVAILSTYQSRQTHVYSLKSDSWTRITDNCPRCSKGPGVFVCGALNWLSFGESMGAYDGKIVSLDLATEKYTLLQVPHSTMGLSNMSSGMSLDVLGGCLVLYENGSLGCLDAWVMKGYGDEGSWTKLFSLDWRNHFHWLWVTFIMPVAFIRKEEDKTRLQVFLQVESNDYYTGFFLFDVETNSMKRVFVHGYDRDLCAQKMSPRSIFRLHANCGGGARSRKRGTEKEKAANKKRLVVCIKDANYLPDDDNPDFGCWEYYLSSDCPQDRTAVKSRRV